MRIEAVGGVFSLTARHSAIVLGFAQGWLCKCMTFRHRDPRWGKLIETTEVKRGEVRKVGRSCDQRSPEVHAEEGLSA